ncbi:MAG TPA: hypothetical protein PLL19_09005, partial [Thiobacillaceae bacterium]|nr:hypothetical protein [Thiobacillaceae bacterium]HNF89456.1 hypothetical protein [Thiobacillaceae bacterium]
TPRLQCGGPTRESGWTQPITETRLFRAGDAIEEIVLVGHENIFVLIVFAGIPQFDFPFHGHDSLQFGSVSPSSPQPMKFR